MPDLRLSPCAILQISISLRATRSIARSFKRRNETQSVLNANTHALDWERAWWCAAKLAQHDARVWKIKQISGRQRVRLRRGQDRTTRDPAAWKTRRVIASARKRSAREPNHGPWHEIYAGVQRSGVYTTDPLHSLVRIRVQGYPIQRLRGFNHSATLIDFTHHLYAVSTGGVLCDLRHVMVGHVGNPNVDGTLVLF